jgi:hypothetical protein
MACRRIDQSQEFGRPQFLAAAQRDQARAALFLPGPFSGREQKPLSGLLNLVARFNQIEG